MPCTDGREDSTHVLKRQIRERDDKYSMLANVLLNREAMLCAILNNLTRRGIIDDVIKDSEQSGKVNISDFWKKHQFADEDRLREDLKKYSRDEIEVLKALLRAK